MAALLGIGGILFLRFEPEKDHSPIEAIYVTWSLVFGQPAEAFPSSPLLQALFFLVPIIGLTIIIEGIIDLAEIFGALEAGDAIDWVDLEIFSDDGSFSDMDFDDSLWKQDPVEVCLRGKAGFDKAWAARKAPS